MNRKLLTLAFGVLAATVGHAIVLQDWQFDDPTDTRLDQTANTGTLGTAWNFRMGNPDEGLTYGGNFIIGDDGLDGAGSLTISTDYTRKATFTESALLSGEYTFEISLNSWNLTGATSSTAGQGITFKLGDTTGNTVNLVFDWRATDNIRTRHAVSGALTGDASQQGGFADAGSGLILQVSGNLDDGSFSTAYSTDGGSIFTDLITNGGGLTQIDEIILTVEGTDPWKDGEFVAVDHVQLQTVAVPEPATFALMAGFAALGLIVYRRRRRANSQACS